MKESIVKPYLDRIDQSLLCRKVNVRNICADVKYCKLHYDIEVWEYFRYRLYQCSEYQRKQFMCDNEADRLLYKHRDPESFNILQDKYECYKYFKEYYNREIIKITSDEDIVQFRDFCSRHPWSFVKPIDQCGGHGAFILKLEDYSNIYEAFIALRKLSSAMVVEELIEQGEEMAVFHPKSINTVRIVTYNNNGAVSIIQSSTRLGTGDSIIDNGCLYATIDAKDGFITSWGRGAYDQSLVVRHPDTNTIIVGYQLPQWDILIAMAKEIALKLPKQKVIGWDFAYSKSGWVIVEGNGRPGMQYFCQNGEGARPIYEQIFGPEETNEYVIIH